MKHIKQLAIAVSMMVNFSIHSSEITREELYKKVDTCINAQQYAQAEKIIISLFKTQPSPNATDYFRIGNLFCQCGNLPYALECYKQTAQLIPGNINPAYNIAYLLKLMGRIDEAISLYTKILALDPQHDAAHLGLAFAYLQKGDFENGWKAHEYNLQKQEKFAASLRTLIQNNDLRDKRILLTPEGGLGDSIHFVRYAKKLHDAGAYVMVMPQKALIPLFSLCPYIDALVDRDVQIPPFHAHATLMSTPAALYDNPLESTQPIPYLFSDPDLLEKWQLRTGADRNFKVGICWQADVFNDSSRLPVARRGIPLSLFEQLNHYSNVSWYSLQKYDGVEQLNSISPHFKIITYDDLDTQTGAFMDTTALIESLDLVITIDSAIAHLAGGLGKEVWLLLPYVADWRWIDSSSTTPWYPTMTIFKQQRPFDWSNVIEAVNKKLEEKSKEHAQNVTTVSTEVSIGELIDKITILTIKNKKIDDAKKLKNIRTELATLRATQHQAVPALSMLDVLETELFETNSKLWEIEDLIRDKERAQLFDDEFIQLARNVYFTNDHRMSIKHKINDLCGSRINEEKSYKPY